MQVESTSFALKFWWAFLWRAFVFSFGFMFIIGFCFGFVGALIGADKEQTAKLLLLVAFVLGVPLQIWVLGKVLRKNWNGYRLQLVPVSGVSVGTLPPTHVGASWPNVQR